MRRGIFVPNPDSGVYTYSYDKDDRLVGTKNPLSETEKYTYDAGSRLTAFTDRMNLTERYTWGNHNNLTGKTATGGEKMNYGYDILGNLIYVQDPMGQKTKYTYDSMNNLTSITDALGRKTAYTCDECGWVISQYDYTYDKNGYIASEKAVESLYGYAWDDKHNGKHEDGRHDDKLPHGSKHNGKHDKDGEYHFQLVETDREFTYDENGRLLSSKEQEENSGLTAYEYTYDAVGNRLSYVKKTQTTKHPNKTDVAESAFYQYNDANQLVSAKLFDGKKNTTVTYTYDENGNLISEIGKYGTDQVETYYDYTVENRLQAVYDGEELLMAAAYDGDGNRVFQLNYNLHTDEDWKGNNGNGNGNNKDNAGSGNNGNGNSNSRNNGNNGNGNGSSISGNDISIGNNGNPGNSGNGKGEGNTGNTGNDGNGNGNGNSGNNGNDKESSKSEGTDDAGYGNATNAEEHNSQNQSGILFPIAEEISRTETDLIAMIKTTGKEKNYELIEYISNVNTQYTQVLMEFNENGAMDAAYTYGVSRLTEDRFTGESNFYLYDPSGNVAGITDQDGYLWQSYRYDAFGNAAFGSPQYDNEYTFNAESYNPNIHSQYLRARYYDTVKGSFLTEDSYLGDIRNPLTLNRYSYCIGNPLFYSDPSGKRPSPYDEIDFEAREKGMTNALQGHQDRVNEVMDNIYDWLGEEDRSSAEQFVDGFITGFAGSFYATYDSITNPESVLALACNILNHPFKTLAGIAKNAFVGNSEQVLYYIKTKNYRALGQDMGYTAGKIAQVAIARAAIKKCGELSNEKGGETPSPGGETPLSQSINEEGVNVNPQSPMFGEDWHRYFNETYGKESVTWETASIQDIIDMPSRITDFSPTQIADLAQANGWSVGPLGKGSLAGIPYEQGGGFSMHAPNGGSEYIQYHPGGGHHGELPYFKVSSGLNGIKRFFMGEN